MQSGTMIGGRYRVEREIGRGSFGIVYLADDLQSGEPRAIKILLPWAAQNESLRHRLRREAKLASHLTGPHIVRIYECDEAADGNVYLVMEYLEGRELDLELRDYGPLSPDRTAAIATQVLDALTEAHTLGVIHRDLKPNNIFLCTDRDARDFVKVFDFGIAKVSGSGSLMETAKLTLQGGVMGTPVYMSPEQCRGEALTPASDFYSLGIVLYELLTGQVPFDDKNPVQILLMHNNQPVPPLPNNLARTALGTAISRALEKDPLDRFASAADFAAAIAGQDIPRPLRPTTAPAKSVAPSAVAVDRAIAHDTPHAPAEERTISSQEPPKFSLLVLGAIVVSGLLLAAAIALMFLR